MTAPPFSEHLHTPGIATADAQRLGPRVGRLFASLGFGALATTSGGFAATRGQLDGSMSKDEVLAHTADLCGATELPLSADLENCFAHDPEGAAATVTEAIAAGVAGCSIEDFSGDRDDPIYELAQAVDRVRAAAEAAHNGARRIVLTARAENYLHGRVDLADTIARLTAYQEAGADVLFAPRVDSPAEVRQLMAAVDIPVSVLITPGAPPWQSWANSG